ncbi:hypothetical protein [Maribacter forsetii]|uniref:hypothetical protein n=1 Tax=Maribacter forsetii TaxID=444515 RepID=UPI00056D96E3|nr:hypothetical protein [Maribacter forsetii]
MKTNHCLLQAFLLILVFCSFSSVETNELKEPFQQKSEETNCKTSVLGVWKYTMTNVDEPYEKGMFFITKKGDSYDVAVKLGTGVLTGQDIVVQNNSINFNVNFEGLKRVSFVLKVEGDVIMGEGYSAKGTSEILGVRQLPGQ